MKRLLSFAAISTLALFIQSTKKDIHWGKNFVALNDSIQICKYETTIGEYSEYLESIKKDSSLAFYSSQLADSSTLGYIEAANTYYKCPYFMGYFNHPAYNNFPVIGISYEQALNYCRWKTVLLKTQSKKSVIVRLPTKEEWEQAAGDGKLYISKSVKNYKDPYFSKRILDSLGIKTSGNIYKTHFNTKDISMLIYKDSIYQYLKPIPDQYQPKAQPEQVFNSVQNNLGLLHMEGNVSEMTQTKGLAKGLSFLDRYNENFRRSNIKYSNAEAWLGFRVVVVNAKQTDPIKN